jgi:hypothetical protein
MEQGQGNSSICGDFEDKAVTDNLPARRDGRSVPKLGAQLRLALDAMIYEALPWDQAAIKAGLQVRGMRKAMRRPHVLQYLRDERQVLLAAISTATPLRLAQLRDQDENRNAAVNACRVLENLDADMPMRGGQASAPGFVIVLNTHAGALTQGDGNSAIVIETPSRRDSTSAADGALVGQFDGDQDP